MQTTKNARVHRFNEYVAISIGENDTQYISRQLAVKLARAMLDCAWDIQKRDFLNSEFNTIEFENL